MPATGKIQVHTYSSFARIPLQNVAITITAEDGTAIAMALTDRSGKIEPIDIPVPDLSESLSPGSALPPFASVNLDARLKGYTQIHVEGVQVFPGTITDQYLEMVPLSEMPSGRNQYEDFVTPPQNL